MPGTVIPGHGFTVTYYREAKDGDKNGTGFLGMTSEGNLVEVPYFIPPDGITLLNGADGKPIHFTRTVSDSDYGDKVKIRTTKVPQYLIDLNKDNPAFSDIEVVSPSGEVYRY